ncbi:BTAD domain-containing putative transcriptional regulator [Microvirga sp. CF3062]|uniref:BTAD domain-containing putative transcriptional regulator n=1 Tax=Microvirga sp. CF3062 TaxID=3110182 RepID=UPI002E77AAD6|nr:BTAD domain-containing putative transcriptional regulator [Microvirga sp. CF3062]MEE1656390.1 BTAD domain-containing putative transcriptional regulator [Microvirga sp. CF3062]
MGGSVGSAVETTKTADLNRVAPVAVRMLGPLTVTCGDIPIALPASRKVRGLFAYLALAPHAVTRSHLCELLWDVPNDPRGELRWSLSKIRRLVGEAGRIRTDNDTISLDLTGCHVDALQLDGMAAQGVPLEPLTTLCRMADGFAGEFLDGLELDRSPAFNAWLVAQRRRFRGLQTQVLEHLVDHLEDIEAGRYLERWVALCPLDERVHGRLLRMLARQQRVQEGKDHLDAVIRLFDAEGLDSAPLREVWRQAIVQPPRAAPTQAVVAADAPAPAAAPSHGSIAVMPFADESGTPRIRGGVADALVHDVITRLAKLRSLFVISQGSTFALHERNVPPDEAGRLLNVDYVVSGSIRRSTGHLTVQVELAEVRTGRIVWADILSHSIDDAFLVLDEIGNRIVATVASEIEAVERNRAILKPPNSLDAWEAHHRGLWHMYRFNKQDNDAAQRFFTQALTIDPTFARAYAGLSFTHFQNAFQGWAERRPQVDHALRAAGQGLMIDDRDPAAHWAMGRALWLHGNFEQTLRELETSVDLSPNFAQGHYTLGFVHSQAGDPEIAIAAADQSRRLSPYDPLLFGMLGSRAMALIRLGRFEEAAVAGMTAASRPNAHAHIAAIAALALSFAGRLGEARDYLAGIRATLPGYGVGHFLSAMQLGPDDQALFREAARRIGMDDSP